jgi:hypothetical protein
MLIWENWNIKTIGFKESRIKGFIFTRPSLNPLATGILESCLYNEVTNYVTGS